MINTSLLYEFLQKIDDDFIPKLSEKVNLLEFVDKIVNKAELIIDAEDGLIRGLIVLYCNNTYDRVAYISLVGVDPLFRGKGIAKRLMSQAIEISRTRGMKCLQIHSNNPVAIKIYRSLGFVIISGDDRKLLEYCL